MKFNEFANYQITVLEMKTGGNLPLGLRLLDDEDRAVSI